MGPDLAERSLFRDSIDIQLDQLCNFSQPQFFEVAQVPFFLKHDRVEDFENGLAPTHGLEDEDMAQHDVVLGVLEGFIHLFVQNHPSDHVATCEQLDCFLLEAKVDVGIKDELLGLFLFSGNDDRFFLVGELIVEMTEHPDSLDFDFSVVQLLCGRDDGEHLSDIILFVFEFGCFEKEKRLYQFGWGPSLGKVKN